ncbi:MAG: hypothetical protein E7538_05335 [Ruminococcaceae bacterium]|nr:hypothetical protein [Oscillospiraceae bacterium]
MTLMSFTRLLVSILMVGVNLFNYAFNDYAFPAHSTHGAYLFCYFTGNEVSEQTIHLAVSTDGYNFKALNNNEPIIEQTKGTGCVRDPYIFKAVDEKGKDCYYIVATDMNALEGWTSNHRIIFWKSYDLISWEDEYLLDFRQFEGFENCNRAWAPQVIWDEKEEKYMLYLALSEWDDPETAENEDAAQHYYLYTTDFKSFTDPEYLYGRRNESGTREDGYSYNGVQCIDGDMIYNEKDGYYYLYFKEDLTQKIAYVKSKNASGPFNEDYTICSLNWYGVEGSTMYRINGTNAWMMIMDEYGEGTFFAQMTRDFDSFRQVQRARYSVNHLNPRHGSVVSVSEKEYYRLARAYGLQDIK